MLSYEPAELHKHLHAIGPQQAKQFLIEQHNLVQQLREVKILVGGDSLIDVTQGYGVA